MYVRTFSHRDFDGLESGMEKIPTGKPNHEIYFSDLFPERIKKIEITEKKINHENEKEEDSHSENSKKHVTRRVSFDGQSDYDEKYNIEEEVEKEVEVGLKNEIDDGYNPKGKYRNKNLKINTERNRRLSVEEETKKKMEETKKLNASVRAAFGVGEFEELASEILRNTFYNLVLECTHDEFNITADTLSFLINKY